MQYLKFDGDEIVVAAQTPIPEKYFGEGCDYVGFGDDKKIYQLTWQEGKM